MATRSHTVAFVGANARPVEVQCALSPGLPSFSIVGLPNKSITEARERIRSALASLALSLPSKRITINLAPADLPKDGSHFDLPIALTLLAAIGAIPEDSVENLLSLGELTLMGDIAPVRGALPAAMQASGQSLQMLCPKANATEAAWAGAPAVMGARSLLEALKHLNGQTPIKPAAPGTPAPAAHRVDLADVKGQERAKRALEIAAAGRHHLMMIGPPGAGKSMLAARLPTILPDMNAQEALETAMIQSMAGDIANGEISRRRPFRAPHHSASMAAMVGGGRDAMPGEISRAHNGVLFLDEMPEFQRPVLDSLRQPLESGTITITRANAQSRHPCRFMLIAAANPCRCGHLFDAGRACARAPICAAEYLGKVSGPLMDRIDLRIELPPVPISELSYAGAGERSRHIAARVASANALQQKRYSDHPAIFSNATADGPILEELATPDAEGRGLLLRAAEQLQLSARGYHRILRVARTIADLDESAQVRRPHIAEALSFRSPDQIPG